MPEIHIWPDGVPSCIMPMSPSGGLRDNRYSFETDNSGPPKERPASSWAPEVYSVVLTPLSRSQFQTFQDWYANVLAYGSEPFVFPHPITGDEGVWKIVKNSPPYEVSKVGRMPIGTDRRRISLSFSIMSLPFSVPET